MGAAEPPLVPPGDDSCVAIACLLHVYAYPGAPSVGRERATTFYVKEKASLAPIKTNVELKTSLLLSVRKQRPVFRSGRGRGAASLLSRGRQHVQYPCSFCAVGLWGRYGRWGVERTFGNLLIEFETNKIGSRGVRSCQRFLRNRVSC